MEDITLRKALEEYKTIYMAYRNFADRTRVEYINDLEGFIEFAEKAGINYAKGVGLPIVERFIAGLGTQRLFQFDQEKKSCCHPFIPNISISGRLYSRQYWLKDHFAVY